MTIAAMTIVVFVGPTLDAAAVRAALEAEIRPPAAHGDLYRAVLAGAGAIGLIDGAFLDVASVWHREILHALSRGVHVFGAASMGALRAAELEAFGMRGVGAIFAAYRDGRWPGCDEPFEDDDEVAVIHAPEAAGGLALSDAMVDLRATLLAARASGIVSPTRGDALIAAMKGLHYPERRFSRLAEAAPELADWLDANRVSQKRLDALLMLRTMADFLAANPEPHMAGFQFSRALVWERFVAGEASAVDAATRSVLDELRLDPQAWREAVRAAHGEPEPPRPASETARRHALDGLRRRHGLWRHADLAAWTEANGLDAAALTRVLDREAALDRMVAEAGATLDRRVADQLRATGAFAPLRARVQRMPDVAAPPEGPSLAALHDWYFERLGTAAPAALETWVASNGWTDRLHFDSAAWRRYRYETSIEAPPCACPHDPD